MNFYFYDYETFSIFPKNARIAQFAGIRTDDNLNIIEEKTLYCKPCFDSLPDPQACNITGISPKECLKKGIIEREFITAINTQFSQPETIIVGYNNIRFDDEITRYTLYRNFLDPYEWAWKNKNSRWDIIDVVRMCYALKPHNSIKWAIEEGAVNFKLENLARNNNISQRAHDALEDVKATIKIAKLIKESQPKLFDYALSLRHKKQVAKTLQLFTPILHTSRMYPTVLGCTRRCTAIGMTSLGNYIIFNLDRDPVQLLELSVEELQLLIFSKKDELPEGSERLDIKELHPNKSPMFVPNVYKLDENTCQHLNIDMAQTTKHFDFVVKHQTEINSKITQVFAPREYSKEGIDVEQQLYDGFLSPNDKKQAQIIASASKEQISTLSPTFEDDKLHTLFTHFKARNYPDLLTENEEEYWFEVVQSRIRDEVNNFISVDQFEEILSELQRDYPEKEQLWQELNDYLEEII